MKSFILALSILASFSAFSVTGDLHCSVVCLSDLKLSTPGAASFKNGGNLVRFKGLTDTINNLNDYSWSSSKTFISEWLGSDSIDLTVSYDSRGYSVEVSQKNDTGDIINGVETIHRIEDRAWLVLKGQNDISLIEVECRLRLM